MGFLQNARKPEGIMGSLILKKMNFGHSNLSLWALENIDVSKAGRALDIGCGGGANLRRLLRLCEDGRIYGMDYSEVSVEASRRNVRRFAKRCEVVLGDVQKIPFEDEFFDVVTAFETVYFWPNIADCFSQVFRVLKPNGKFLICCEACNPNSQITSKISGMTIYTRSELEALLERSGFETVCSKQKEDCEWICVIGRKP